MKILKSLTISFFAAVLTVLGLFGGYTLYAAVDDRKINFREEGLNFYQVTEAYHSEINNYFNDKFNKLHSLVKKDPHFYKAKEFKVPKKDENQNEPDASQCDEENLSTYCISMGALNIYMDYVDILDALSSTLANETKQVNLENVLFHTKERNEKIALEYDQARNAMESTIAAFNEYKLAYPMHVKYQKVIEELLKYKLLLKDLRIEVQEFPVRFIDATTSRCE